MRNAVLHLITNKSGDFGSSLLPSYSSYVPHTPSAAEQAIRTALKINDGLYYLLNSMTAVYAFPCVLADFNETETTFRLSDFNSDPLQIVNASYYNTTSSNFSLKLKPTTFPESNYFNWVVSYNDSSTLNFYCCNQAFTVAYTLSLADDGAQVISADWPSVSGMGGGLKLPAGQTWASDYTINIYAPPITFPYEAAVAKASQLPGTANILSEAGVARNFANAQSAIEKYALLMLAISRPELRNPYIKNC